MIGFNFAYLIFWLSEELNKETNQIQKYLQECKLYLSLLTFQFIK